MVTSSLNSDKEKSRIESEIPNSPLDSIGCKKTRALSIYEGIFGMFSNSFSDNFLVPFALVIGSSPFQIGLLNSMAGIVSPTGQIWGSRMMEKYPRHNIMNLAIAGIWICWIFYLIIAVISKSNPFNPFLIWAVIFVYMIYNLGAGVNNPPWFSMMGDVIAPNNRGRYFALRNLVTTSIAIIGTLACSFFLEDFRQKNSVLDGFIFVFAFAFILRGISLIFFTKFYVPPFKFDISDHITLKQFFKEIPRSNFGLFTTFVALLTFGQYISTPFFSVYMLQVLNFDYFTYTYINLAISIVALGIFPIIGKISDKYGNVRVLKFGSAIIWFLPILWLFVDTPIGILLGPQLLGGIGWTAFNLATSNFIYDNIPSQRRGEYVAFYNFLLGIGIISGGLMGSLIVQYFPISLMSPYLFVFLISGLFRIIIIILFLPKIKEVRVNTKPIYNIKNTSLYRWLYDILMRDHNHNPKNEK